MNWWDWMSWSSFFECWVLSQPFHFPLSPSSRGSLISLQFLQFGWTPGIDDGQGGLAYCSPWGPRVGHDWATKLNWTELMELDAMILVFWMLSFKPTFSLSSLTFIKWLFSFSLLSAIRVVSSAYLRLLIFLPAILIPTCASSDLAFHMMYSAHKLNKQGDNI